MFDWLWDLEFERWYLLLLGLLAPLVYVLARRQGGQIKFSSLGLLPAPTHATSWRVKLIWLPAALLAASELLLSIVAAGPRTFKEEIRDQLDKKQFESISLMMVVDTSGSMAALDLSTPTQELTRLDVVKRAFVDFVKGDGALLPGRPQDLVGLVSFAGHADSVNPLTLDHTHLLNKARALALVTERSEDGTAIGDGLGLAVERLRSAPTKSRVAILLTDGENNAGDSSPQESADLAKKLGIRVYTIGAGSLSGQAEVRVPTDDGGSRLMSVRVGLDETLLKEIAETTGGKYFRAGDNQALRDIYAEIDRLERTEIKQAEAIQLKDSDYEHHYQGFMTLAFLFAGAGWALGETWLRRLP